MSGGKEKMKLEAAAYALAAELGTREAIEYLESVLRKLKDHLWETGE